MIKEFMKIGPITCSILADPPYKQVRNGKTDFTLAKEKPNLSSQLACTTLETGGKSCEYATSNFSVRMNKLGAEILTMCGGKKTIEQIAVDLAEKYDYDDDEFVEQVKTFLNVFRTYKLL
jgi:hypothetical protein